MIRDEPPPPGNAILVRALFDAHPGGQVFDRAVLVADATYNFHQFGYYGLSLWLVSEPWPVDRVLAEKCCRARRVVMFTAMALRGSGLSLVPSGRDPHYDASLGTVYGQHSSVRVTVPTAGELVDRFVSTAYTLRDNEFHDPAQD